MQLGGLDSQYLDNEYQYTYRKFNQDRCGQTVHQNGQGHFVIYFDLFCSYIIYLFSATNERNWRTSKPHACGNCRRQSSDERCKGSTPWSEVEVVIP